ncbi:hypothetical protein [Chryseobacterium sp. IHB B 17019]|nr:hypothetical protein [Chryseobacterium sp. IHB B 17019]
MGSLPELCLNAFNLGTKMFAGWFDMTNSVYWKIMQHAIFRKK